MHERRHKAHDPRAKGRLPGVLAALMMTGCLTGGCSKKPLPGLAQPSGIPQQSFQEPEAQEPAVDLHDLMSDLFQEERLHAAIERLDGAWRPAYAAALVDFLRVSYERQQPGFREACFAVIALLQVRSGESYGGSISAWYRWLWDQGEDEFQGAAHVKASLFGRIDPRFARYFGEANLTEKWEPWPRTIRLDEVRWGGVEQDGIPPLRAPRVLAAAEADYLEDHHIVYGVVVNGEARAYPRRILGWHELVTDRLGGVDITGVYCTLCGTMIVYESRSKAGVHTLGTSGFLYRSNKLMYDEETQSLWSTLLGEPVIGPLAKTGAKLARRAAVASTWGEWQTRHPETTVLHVETGFDRDYSEGAAYADYYATDELMFDVPEQDARLANKAEVIGLVMDGPNGPEALALSVDFLRAHTLHVEEFQGRRIALLTDPSGAVRAYEIPEAAHWTNWGGEDAVQDASGRRWSLTEDAVESPEGVRAPRLESTRSFWFAWHAAHPGTELRRE